jgi:uroporphyrinogen decarboxylase
MKEFTGRERIEAAIRRERVDRVPYNIDIGPHYSSEIGYSTDQYFGDIDIAIECHVKAVEAYPSDLVTVPQNIPVWWALKELYRFRTSKEEIADGILKDKKALQDLEAIPSDECGSIDQVIESCRKVTGFAGKGWATRAAALGPIIDAVRLVGLEDWIVDTKEDPQFIHDLMRFGTDAAKSRIERIIKSTDVMIFVVADTFASCSTISPKIYREFVFPYEKELFESIDEEAKARTLIGLHICGYLDPIMKDIANLGADWVELDGPSSLNQMVEESAGKIIIRGNVGAEIFSEGNKDQIDEAVKNCIETAAGGNAYVLSTGCQIPLNTPLENVRYFMEAAQKYGRYDQ